MKILKFTGLALLAFLVVTSIFGSIAGLQAMLLCLGLQEFIHAKEYYDSQQKKFALASLVAGAFAFVCLFFSVTNII